jgi:hypothetical protein
MASASSSAFEDLVAAYEWVSSDPGGENAAYVSRETGRVYWLTDAVESEDELPDDLEDGTQYLAVPHKHDLDLGNALALQFVNAALPSRYRDAVEFFRHPGAYRRLKAMLERAHKLDEWHEYEAAAVQGALRSWVTDNELPIPLPSESGEA